MSEAEDSTPADTPEEVEETDADSTEQDPDERPELNDDEMADWGSVGVEDEKESQDDSDSSESESEVGETADESDQDDAPEMEMGGRDTTLGTIYCNALGMGAATVRDRYGELDQERGEAIEEYAALAEQLEIDQYIDEWMATRGGIDELPPHVAAMLMTFAFAGMVAVDDPELATNALDHMEGFDGI